METFNQNAVPVEVKNQKLFLVASIVTTIVAAGVAMAVYVNSNDVPPKLSFGGESVQGMIETGKQGFLQYQDRDKDNYREFVADYEDEHSDADKYTLDAGVNYVSVPRDIRVGDLRKCIDPKADRVLFAQYDADEGNFMVYPEGPFEDTVLIDDLDYEFKKGTGMVIITKEKTDTYCVADPQDKTNVDVTAPMDSEVKGWVLVASNEDNVTDFIAPFKDRVLKVWKMTDTDEFKKVNEADYGDDLGDYFLLWLKLDKGENGGEDVNGDIAPKNLKFEADAVQFVNRLSWDVSPETHNDKDLTGYMVSMRKSEQGPDEAVKTYYEPNEYTVANGRATVLLGEIFPGDVHVVRVGAVYDDEKDVPYYSAEFNVSIADDGTVVPPADLAVVPTNVVVDADNFSGEVISGTRVDPVDINGDGKINFLDLFIGVSWTRVASVEGRTVTGYTVKWSVCDNAGGVAQNCVEKPAVVVEGANAFEYSIREAIEFGKIYKVAVAANITQRNGDLKFSDYVEQKLPSFDELNPHDFADVFKDLSVPMNLRVTAVADGSVKLEWDSVTGDGSNVIPGYEVLYMPFDPDKNFNREDDRTVAAFGRVNQATIDGLLSDGTQYVFVVKVKGFDYNGESFSNFVFAVPKAGATGLVGPTMGSVTALANGHVQISNWADPVIPAGYVVKNYFIFGHDNKRFLEATVLESNIRTVEIDELELNKDYAFAIAAVYTKDGKDVFSNYSEWKTVHTVSGVVQ